MPHLSVKLAFIVLQLICFLWIDFILLIKHVISDFSCAVASLDVALYVLAYFSVWVVVRVYNTTSVVQMKWMNISVKLKWGRTVSSTAKSLHFKPSLKSFTFHVTGMKLCGTDQTHTNDIDTCGFIWGTVRLDERQCICIGCLRTFAWGILSYRKKKPWKKSKSVWI